MSGEHPTPSIRELRLRYTVEGMTRLITHLDGMNLLSTLPGDVGLFLVHASNAANWHEVEEESV